VLDRLLEEERLRIVAISGTSAGAMNAAVLADGWAEGGAAGARAALRAYWQEVSRAAALSPLQRSPLDRMMGRWTLDTSPAYIAMDLMSRLLSPYDLNPLAYNPLRKILVKCIDFERLAGSPIKLFVTATSVRTGRGRIFRNADISADVLLASACLPTMFRAIEIGGEPYWDGGYAGNPTITPLIRESDAHDTILVHGCKGHRGKEVCGAVECAGARATGSTCPQGQRPGETAAEGAHSPKGRCLGGRARVE
jgi:NTE family protein